MKKVTWDSLTGTMTHLATGVVHLLTAILCVLPTMSFLPHHTVAWLECIGGLGFLIAGICEVSHMCFGHHDDHHHASHVGEAVAWLNLVGGVGFFIGGLVELFAHHYHTVIHGCLLVGWSLNSIAGVLLLIMWRGNDFGGSLLSQLNSHISSGNVVSIEQGSEGVQISLEKKPERERRPSISDRMSSAISKVRKMSDAMTDTITHKAPDAARKISESVHDTFSLESHKHEATLSLRGVISLSMYCWLFVCTTINFVMGLLLVPTGHRSICDVAMTLVWMLVIKVVLVVHSAVTTIPNEQPYRFAMQTTRFLLVVAAAVQTVHLFNSLILLQDIPGGPIADAHTVLVAHGGASSHHRDGEL